jgi:hypothetical protein
VRTELLGLILNKIMGVRPDPLSEQRDRLRGQVRRIAEIGLRNANARAASRLEQLQSEGIPFHRAPQPQPEQARPPSYHAVPIYETDAATGYPFKAALHFEQDPLFGWLDGFGFGFPDMDLSNTIPVSAFPRELFPERPSTLRTQIAMDAVRFQSRAWFETIPQYSGPIGHLINYVVGDGMEIDVVPREKDDHAEEVEYEQDAPPANKATPEGESEPGQAEEATDPDELLAKAVQKYLDAFAEFEHNRLLERVSESVLNLLRDGEDCLRVYPGKKFPSVRSIDTSTIRGPHNEIYGPWSFGLLTSWPNDFEDVKAFHLWKPDNTHENVSPELMSLVKLETTGSNVKRGVPMAYAARKQLPQMAKLLDCMAVGEAARQAIPYIRQFNVADRAAVRAATPSSLDTWALADAEYNAAIGYAERSENDIRPGEVPLINRGQEFVDTPGGRAESGAMAYRTLCESLATCWQVPIWFITGSADSENYASSLVSESPVVKKVNRIQAKICGHYEAICKAVLNLAVKAGKFPEDLLERIEVHCELSTPAVRDPDKAIDSDIKLLDKKLLSPQHLCTRNGLDFEEESDLIAQAEQEGWQAQTEMELAQADQLANQGENGPPKPEK